MIAELDGPDFPSTYYFDEKGDMVRIRGFMFNERREYDSLHFIRRILSKTDVDWNEVFNYQMKNGILRQESIVMEHSNWEIHEGDIGEDTTVGYFNFDKRGRVVERRLPNEGAHTRFKYDKSGLLTSMATYYKDTLITEVLYFYNENGRLTRREQPNQVDYFTDGRLDSTAHKYYTVKYTYLYFKAKKS